MTICLVVQVVQQVQRPGHPELVVPVPLDLRDLDPLATHAAQRPVVGLRVDPPEPSFSEVACRRGGGILAMACARDAAANRARA